MQISKAVVETQDILMSCRGICKFVCSMLKLIFFKSEVHLLFHKTVKKRNLELDLGT